MKPKNCPVHPRKIHQYVISAELGSGSFATVYKAFNTKNRRNYAIKIMPKSKLMNEGDTRRFQRELNASSFLRHDNIVAVHDFFWDDNNFYLVQDICNGGDLFHYITKNDHLEEPVAAFLFLQVCKAIEYCHSYNVAHRDLKPENVLIDKFPHVKITDFGLCGYIKDDIKMKTFCGSTAYCSPECLCATEYDGRLSDIWSLGILLFVMVTGDSPWDQNTGKMITQIKNADFNIPPQISDQCRDLITRMVRIDPVDRITIQEIIQHPWMKMADESGLKMPVIKPDDLQKLPPLEGYTLEEIAQMSKEESTVTEEKYGIVSPFERTYQKKIKTSDNEDDEDEYEECDPTNKAPLPMFSFRCNSVENLIKNAHVKKITVPKAQGKSITLQRSRKIHKSTNFLSQTLPPMK